MTSLCCQCNECSKSSYAYNPTSSLSQVQRPPRPGQQRVEPEDHRGAAQGLGRVPVPGDSDQ